MARAKIISNLSRVLMRFQQGTRDLGRELERIANQGAWSIVNRAYSHYLAGQSLSVQSGSGRAAVKVKPASGARKVGRTYTSNIVVERQGFYLVAWEEGFHVPAYTVYPKRARALRFAVGGQIVFAKSAHIPARYEKPRKWLQPSVDDEMPGIRRAIMLAGGRVVR